jgi:hypothetical protein
MKIKIDEPLENYGVQFFVGNQLTPVPAEYKRFDYEARLFDGARTAYSPGLLWCKSKEDAETVIEAWNKAGNEVYHYKLQDKPLPFNYTPSLSKQEQEHLAPILASLCDVTTECRGDMHEPDEQGIKAVVLGDHLDNAMGADPDTNYGEFTVGIQQWEDDVVVNTAWFNLADLIALARTSAV